MDLSRFNWRVVLSVATVAMLIQQAFSYVCQMVMPILADSIADEFGISPAWLGLYLFIQNLMAILAAAGCGGFILRLGPLRVSQLALVMMACSLLLLASAQLWLYPLAAILLGASAVSTPASSHILARVCPPRLAPLIFSIKQTGVPVGALIGGLMIPFFLGLTIYSTTFDRTFSIGPFGAALLTAMIVFIVAGLLQPVRGYFDAERKPELKITFGNMRATMNIVLKNPALRDIAFAAFAFGGLQSLFAGFFFLFLIDRLDHSEVEVGSVFAISSVTAIVARILWGWLGGRLVAPLRILGAIGLFGGLAAILMAGFDATSSIFEITAVAILYNITALSWHGLVLAETARLAPEGQVGGVTGGLLSFTSMAMLIYPAVYGLLLAYTDSYKIGFALAAVPAFAACLVFIAGPVQGSWLGLLSRRGSQPGAGKPKD